MCGKGSWCGEAQRRNNCSVRAFGLVHGRSVCSPLFSDSRFYASYSAPVLQEGGNLEYSISGSKKVLWASRTTNRDLGGQLCVSWRKLFLHPRGWAPVSLVLTALRKSVLYLWICYPCLCSSENTMLRPEHLTAQTHWREVKQVSFCSLNQRHFETIRIVKCTA